MLWIAVALAGLAAVYSADIRAKPPKINAGFARLEYFRDNTDVKTFNCEAEGIPEVTYEWQQNGVTVLTEPGKVEVNQGKLQLLAPTSAQEGYYQCLASNPYGTSMSSVTEMQAAGLNGFKTEATQRLGSHDRGSHVILHCRNPPRSIPTAAYDWYAGKSKVTLTEGRVIDQSGSLHFINVQPTDQLSGSLTYNCSLYNEVSQSQVFGSPTTFQVNVNEAPPRDPSVIFFTEPENAIALLNRSVTLQCIPDGYPLPRIEWSKQGGVLPADRHTIVDNDYTLQIVNVTEEDEGTYVCTAVQGNQRAEQTIFVDVKSEPIWVDKLQSMTLTAGKTATFKCVARSAAHEQDNVIVNWFKNGKPLSVSGTEYTVPNVRKPYDLMNIQCNVSNSIGYQMADAFLNVIVATALTVPPKDKMAIDPGQVVEVPIVAKSDPLYQHSLLYRWSKDGQQVSTNPNDPVYVDVANKLIVNATSFGRTTDFLKLLGNYSCLVTMGLEKGEGDILVFTQISSQQAEEILAGAALDLWWIAIIIAVLVLILIIILIFCLLYRNRGGTYPVDEKERGAGHDPEKELAARSFPDLTRAEAPEQKKPSGDLDQVSISYDPPLGGDTGSLDEYGELDFSKFNEDGSFIGNYGIREGRELNQSAV